MMPGIVPRIIDLPESGLAAFQDPHALRPAAGGTLRWIDIERPTPELLEQLRVPFALHPLAIEDCLTFEQRPKLEEYPGHLFIVIHQLELASNDMVGFELHAFLGPNFLITVREHACPQLEKVMSRVLVDADIYSRGLGFVYYLIADRIAVHNLATLEDLAQRIDDVETAVLQQASTEKLPLLFEYKQALAAARRLLSPERDLFAMLIKVGNRVVTERTALYFRDVYDTLLRSGETIEVSREQLSNILEAHFSIVSQRTNEIMKHLTVLSAIFLPLTFITGFFGQNFEALPFASRSLLWVALSSCVVVPLSMLYFFRRRRWL